MKGNINKYCFFLALLVCSFGWGQQSDSDEARASPISFESVYTLAYQGNYTEAQQKLGVLIEEKSNHLEAQALLARTYTWNKQYEKARGQFNKILSKHKSNKDFWVYAIKNELYSGENAIALGLAYKAQKHIQDPELKRLEQLSLDGTKNTKYLKTVSNKAKDLEPTTIKNVAKVDKRKMTKTAKKKMEASKKLKNRFAVNNSVTVFNDRYDPFFFSNFSYKRKTRFGSIIPRINYSSRVGRQGVQYDLDLYPKFAKGFYAYLNYGYSSSSIYPKHKMGGDVYVSLPGSFEFSAGGRHIITQIRTVTGISNSLGHYRGNYYFSLRSLITPKPDGLTRVSGNLLVRKYIKNSENYMGFTAGIGISPELRQFFADDQLLAETIFFIETQRLNLEYQFTNKQNTNIYKARLGVRRQELSFDSGNFFWGFTAGLIYSVKF